MLFRPFIEPEAPLARAPGGAAPKVILEPLLADGDGTPRKMVMAPSAPSLRAHLALAAGTGRISPLCDPHRSRIATWRATSSSGRFVWPGLGVMSGLFESTNWLGRAYICLTAPYTCCLAVEHGHVWVKS